MTKIRAAFAMTAAALAIAVMPCMGADAATKQDVINAAGEAGWSDRLVQESINSIPDDLTPEDYDKLLVKVQDFDREQEKKIWQQLFDEPYPDNEPSAPSPDNGNGNKPPQIKPDKDFSSMTSEEKKDYLSSLTPDERQDFFAGLSKGDKSDIIKDMNLTDKAELVDSLRDMLKEFGITLIIDELSEDNIHISSYDENGNLLGQSSLTMTVDPTGKPYTAPVVAGGTMTIASAAVMTAILKSKRRNHE